MNGIPYRPPPPKSGWSVVRPLALMLWTNAAEFACTGRPEMSVFQGLSAGKTGQPPTVGATPPVGGVVVGTVVALVGGLVGIVVVFGAAIVVVVIGFVVVVIGFAVVVVVAAG